MSTTSTPFRLTRLRVKNFRSIGEIDIPLGPLTVLIGPNGSGKSNVVDALRFLRDCFTRGLDQAILDREGMTVLRRWTAGGRPADISLGITIENENQESVAFDFVLSSQAQQGFTIKREELRILSADNSTVSINKQGENIILYKDGKKQLHQLPDSNRTRLGSKLYGPAEIGFLIGHLDKDERTKKEDNKANFFVRSQLRHYGWGFQQLLEEALFYTLNPTQLRAPQRLVQETPFDEAGQNLSAVLQYLRRHKRTAEEMRQTLGRLVSEIVDFSVSTTGSYLVSYLHYENAAQQVRKADLGQESDGTLRVLGILAALYQRHNSSVPLPARQFIAIEEPEVNIHPGMLAVLAELFQEASTRQQLLLTTHSPDLLDFLPADSFLVVEKVDGETKVGALATDQAEIIRQRLFTAGELLRTEGLHRQADTAATQPAA